MAVATPPAASGEEFHRTLKWTDGFALALCIPVSAFAVVGYSVATLGAWTAIVLWGIACTIALLQNFLFAEMAAMFPSKPGGIALYAHEGWRRYFAPVGPLAAFGYWAGWSLVLSIYGLVIGSLIQAQWFPGADWTVSDGVIDVGLGHFIAAGLIVLVWVLNVFGLRPAVGVNRAVGVLLIVVLAIFIAGPFVTGKWDASNLTWGLGKNGQAWGGLQLALVYLFIMGWTAYGTEIAATFSPEYRDQRRDAVKALISSGGFTLAIMTLMPLAVTGNIGEQAIADNPTGFYVDVFRDIAGSASGLVTAAACLALLLNMTSATADAGRALYGIARDDMTIKQLGQLNRQGMPARAMTLDLVVNLGALFLVGNPLGILFASNVGYMFAVFFAVTGFLLLRRDRPRWPRPIRRGRPWIAIAVALAAINLVLIAVGASNPDVAGYGGAEEQLIGFGILALSLVLFVFRRLVQDRRGLRLKEWTPSVPEEAQPVVAVTEPALPSAPV